MPVVLIGATSGSATVQPTDAATVVLTLPATSGTLALTGGGGGGGITAMTAQSVATLTSIPFTGLPSTVKRITVMFDNVYLPSGIIVVQLGTSGGYIATGYVSGTALTDTTGTYINATSIGFQVYCVGQTVNGSFVITNITGNKWAFSGNGTASATSCISAGGGVDAGGTVTSVRLFASTVIPFTSGNVNIFYE